MPTYEYECTKCKYRFERFQNMTEPAIKECPKCKGFVKRIIGSGAGIIFKGSGFYATDYRSKSYKESVHKENEKIPKKDGNKKGTKKEGKKN